MNRSRERWMPYEDLWLEEELIQGLEIEHIASLHKRSVSAITARLIRTKKRRSTISRSQTLWSIYEDNRLLNEFHLGLSLKFIAKIHLRSIQSIYVRIRQHAVYHILYTDRTIPEISEHFNIRENTLVSDMVRYNENNKSLPQSIMDCYDL